MERQSIYLIDGSSMLSTFYYGNLPAAYKFAKTEEDKQKALQYVMKTKDGRYTNGVYGMTKHILKLVKENNIEHLAVCWDISRNTFRREKYKEYKSHRGVTPLQLSSQFSLMQEVLEKIGIPQFKIDGYEADDIIGTFARRFQKDNDIYILTKDRDALQLINNNVTVWLKTQTNDKLNELVKLHNLEQKYAPNGYFPFTEPVFRASYQGLEPIQLIDLKGLVGDKSDGIPGIDKMGEKTAIPILNNYKSIEDFYEFLELNDAKSAKKILKTKEVTRVNPEKMLQNKDIALLSKELATIVTDIPEYEEITVESTTFKIDEVKKRKIFDELEFYSLA